jgi:hypothetical protein
MVEGAGEGERAQEGLTGLIEAPAIGGQTREHRRGAEWY